MKSNSLPSMKAFFTFLSLTLLAFAFFIVSASYTLAQNQPSATPTPTPFKVGDVPETLKDGDILFHDSGSNQSIGIKKLTRSKYSHVGIYLTDKNGGFVYEAHNGVEKTPIAVWSDRPRSAPNPNTEPWKALRLKDHPDGLSNDEANTLRAFLDPMVKKVAYDALFQWSPDKMYCSELVWKAYEKLHFKVGEQETFANFDLDSDEAKVLAERYGGMEHLPKTETIVTPQAIYKSDSLDLVPPLKER